MVRQTNTFLTLFTLYKEFILISNWLCTLCLDNHDQLETALCSSLRIIPALTAYLLPPWTFTFRWSECSRLVVCRWGQDAGSDYFSSCSIACSRWLKQKSLAELMEEESSLMGTPRFCYRSNHWKGVSNVFQQWWLWSLIYHLKWTPVNFFRRFVFSRRFLFWQNRFVAD